MWGSKRLPARVAGVSTSSRWPSTLSRHTSSGVRNGLSPRTADTSDPPMVLVLSIALVDMLPRPPRRDVEELPLAEWEAPALADGVGCRPTVKEAADLSHHLRRQLAR